MYFGHKHVETGPNCLHELATFVKYHMPLNLTKLSFYNLNSYQFNKVYIITLKSYTFYILIMDEKVLVLCEK